MTATKLVNNIIAEPNLDDLLRRLEPVGGQKDRVTKAISAILTAGTDEKFVRHVVIKFLDWLGSPELDRGTKKTARNKILDVVGDCLGLLEMLKDYLNHAQLKEQETIAWFVQALLSFNNKKWKKNEHIRDMEESFIEIGVRSAKLISDMLKKDFDGSPASVLQGNAGMFLIARIVCISLPPP